MLTTLWFVQAKIKHFEAHDAAAEAYDAIVNRKANENEVDNEDDRFFLGGLFRPRPRSPAVQAALDALRIARANARRAERERCVRAGRLFC